MTFKILLVIKKISTNSAGVLPKKAPFPGKNVRRDS